MTTTIRCDRCQGEGSVEVGLQGNNTDAPHVEVMCVRCAGTGVAACIECGSDATREHDGIAYCSEACEEEWRLSLSEMRADLAADESINAKREEV